MNIPNDSLLNPTPGNPAGYVSKDEMWAAVPCGKKFVIIHNGRQVHISNNYKAARAFIAKAVKGKSVSSLDEFL